MKEMANSVTRKTSIASKASNKVTNLSCEAFLLEDLQVMVCELKTNSTCLALIYKAATGELEAILDINDCQDLPDEVRYGIYSQFNEKLKSNI